MDKASKLSSLSLSKELTIKALPTLNNNPSRSGNREASVNFELVDGTSNEQGSAQVNRSSLNVTGERFEEEKINFQPSQNKSDMNLTEHLQDVPKPQIV